MPQGDKSAYTDKQKRKAEHIAEGYEDRGVPEKEAEGGKPDTHASSHNGGKQAAGRSDAAKSAAAKKGWETRRKNASN
jgi:hypothetical protein